jgi:hypothetical protein
MDVGCPRRGNAESLLINSAKDVPSMLIALFSV